MYKINILFLLVFFLLTGCTKQEYIRAVGTGEYWKAHLEYVVTNSYLYDSGGIEYMGDEELIGVSYTVTTEDSGLSGEVHSAEIGMVISFGTTATDHPLTREEAIQILNFSYIDIKWKTITGEYEETIHLKVK